MCGCSSQPATPFTVSAVQRTVYADGECPFTKEQAAGWLVRVRCVIDNGYYTQIPNISRYQLNLYVGILTSVGNYQGSPCQYGTELEEIESFITVITSMNIC
jgi:hypothetical protein